MKTRLKVLHISPDFNYSCGVSKYLTIILGEMHNYDGVELHFITNGGDGLERLDKLNVKVKIVPFSRGIRNLFIYFNFSKALETYIRENQISIVHTHHRFPEFVASRLKKRTGIKTVSTIHSLTNRFKNISYKSDKLIAVSKTVRNHLINEYSIPESQIIFIYNPVVQPDKIPDKAVSRATLGIPLSKKVILFLGTICKRKGFDVLVEAVKKLYQSHPDILLLAVGKWEEYKIEDYSGKPFIFALPPQPFVENFLSACDLVVAPSRVESLSYLMLESGLYKKPFLCSRVGGMDEFLENQKDGLLITANSTKELAEGIIFLFKNPEIAIEMGNNLKTKVSSLLDVNGYCKKLIGIYESLFSLSYK